MDKQRKRMEMEVKSEMVNNNTFPEIVQGMKIRTFHGLLNHKNPTCTECSSHCYALYRGGKKEKTAMFVCKNCNVIYTLPDQKKCEFTEEKPQ